MFDIGLQETIVIVIAALILIGPDKLPETLRWFRKILNNLNKNYNELIRELMSADLDKPVQSEANLPGISKKSN